MGYTTLQQHVARLGRSWILGRARTREQALEILAELESEHRSLVEVLAEAQRKGEQLESTCHSLELELSEAQREGERLEMQCRSLELDLAGSQHEVERLESEHRTLAQNLVAVQEESGRLNAGLTQTTARLRLVESDLEASKRQVEALSSELDDAQDLVRDHKRKLSRLSAEHEQLQDHHGELEKAHQSISLEVGRQKTVVREQASRIETLSEKEKRWEFTRQALAATGKPIPGLQKFSSLIHDDFLALASGEGPAGRLAIEGMLSLEADLRALATLPIRQKRIGAIGGGFSAGKSAFINSFLSGQIRLPVEIEPTTAIPTYVTSGPESGIVGHTRNGGQFELDTDLYRELKHGWLEGMGFNIRDLVPCLSLQAPTIGDFPTNVCLIDTPGYDPADGNATMARDRSATLAILQGADFLIWLVPLKSGTISHTDLEFLTETEFGRAKKPLYIVATKADELSASSWTLVMDRIADGLKQQSISTNGIAVHCANPAWEKPGSLPVFGQSLEEFLREQDRPGELFDNLPIRLKAILDDFRIALQGAWDDEKDIAKLIKTLRLDMAQMDLSTTEKKISSQPSLISGSFFRALFGLGNTGASSTDTIARLEKLVVTGRFETSLTTLSTLARGLEQSLREVRYCIEEAVVS